MTDVQSLSGISAIIRIARAGRGDRAAGSVVWPGTGLLPAAGFGVLRSHNLLRAGSVLCSLSAPGYLHLHDV
jgi:hypothetical protein